MTTKRIKSITPMQAGKVMGALYGGMALIFVPFLLLFALIPSFLPKAANAPSAGAMWLIETAWFGHRAFWQVMMSGVFERFPNMKFVLTESGCAWLVDMLRMLDGFHMQMAGGRIGELKFDADNRLARPPSEYFAQNCYVGVSFPGVIEAKGMKKLGL